MTIEQPAPGEPRRPLGPRDPGDAWVVAPSGERYWGRFGAAGLLAVDADRGVLLQHRLSWSHFGDTWALPGGARHQGESACDGALREAAEEAGVPDGAIRPRLMSVFDLGYWSYTTLVGDVIEPFEPVISDPESRELAWIPVDDVPSRPLHPGFEASWAQLRPLLSIRPTIVVDVANVVGSVPDGWWRDRAGAAARLIARISALGASGVVGNLIELPVHTWFPEWVAVVEGQARAVAGVGSSGGVAGAGPSGGVAGVGSSGGVAGVGSSGGVAGAGPSRAVAGVGSSGRHGSGPGGRDASAAAAGRVEVVGAAASGDDAIVAQTVRLVSAGRRVTVVTSDRELAQRVSAAGAAVHGARWLLDLLPAA